jgi:uncharacterized protein YjbJ (UPF0337 family)
MSGNDDKAQGTVDQMKGRVEEAAGDLTGNDDQKAKGQTNQAQGKVEKVSGDVKNAVSDITDS